MLALLANYLQRCLSVCPKLRWVKRRGWPTVWPVTSHAGDRGSKPTRASSFFKFMSKITFEIWHEFYGERTIRGDPAQHSLLSNQWCAWMLPIRTVPLGNRVKSTHYEKRPVNSQKNIAVFVAATYNSTVTNFITLMFDGGKMLSLLMVNCLSIQCR